MIQSGLRRLVLPYPSRMIHPWRLVAACPRMIQSGGRRLLLLVSSEMIHSGRLAATCRRMIQSGGLRLLLLGPPRMIKSGEFGLLPSLFAVFLFWPLLPSLPRMM